MENFLQTTVSGGKERKKNLKQKNFAERWKLPLKSWQKVFHCQKIFHSWVYEKRRKAKEKLSRPGSLSWWEKLTFKFLHKEKSQVIQIAAHSNCPRPFTIAQSFNFTGNLYSKNNHQRIFHFFANIQSWEPIEIISWYVREVIIFQAENAWMVHSWATASQNV